MTYFGCTGLDFTFIFLKKVSFHCLSAVEEDSPRGTPQARRKFDSVNSASWGMLNNEICQWRFHTVAQFVKIREAYSVKLFTPLADAERVTITLFRETFTSKLPSVPRFFPRMAAMRNIRNR